MKVAGPLSRVIPFVAAIGLALPVALAAEGEPVRPPAGTPPEQVERRLAQFTVTVTGKQGLVRGLEAADFELMIGGREIRQLIVDDLCRDTVDRAEQGSAEAGAFPVGLVFYFDQMQMSPEGRRNALVTARDLVRRLVVGGNRAMVVSAAARLRVFADWTTDPDALIAAIDAVEADPAQIGTEVAQEPARVDRILSALTEEKQRAALFSRTLSGLSDAPTLDSKFGQRSSTAPRDLSGRVSTEAAMRAAQKKMSQIRDQLRNHNKTASDADAEAGRAAVVALARGFQFDERDRTRRSVERLSALLARIAEAPAPKAVLYFADALRQNPGEHYLRAAGGQTASRSWGASFGQDNFAAGNAVAPVIYKATSAGIRFYAVQAEGLVAISPGQDTGRVRDAQGALTDLAAETGGRAFLNGIPSSKIAGAIDEDRSCSYLISFDPRGLPEDAPLPVTVKATAPGAQVRHPGLFVVEGEATRRSGRLLAAALDAAASSSLEIVAGLVPLDFDGRRYRALAQVAAPATADPDWDLGLTIVSDGTLGGQFAKKVAAPGATIPAVVETEVEVAPGVVTLTALALDRPRDRAGSQTVEATWPDPDAERTCLPPVAILQPIDAAFVRDDAVRTRGSRVLVEDEPVVTDRPVAFVGLVCRSGDGPRTLKIERTLTGEIVVPFATSEVDLRKGRCAQIRDVIRAGTLGPGAFVYAIRAIEDDATVASAERRFSVR